MSSKKAHMQDAINIKHASPLPMNVVLHKLDIFSLSICKKRRLQYGRFADDCTIGTGVNSDSLALHIITQFSQFIKSELGGLYFWVKLIKKVGCILGENQRQFPP